MERLLDILPLMPGQLILDIGSNTCWAAATFARIGLRAVALDISMTEMQGLRTGDWWIEDQDLYFERVLEQMSALPFAQESFDWVFCCEVLHHNDRRGMTRALREAHRVTPSRREPDCERAIAVADQAQARPWRRGRGVRWERACVLRRGVPLDGAASGVLAYPRHGARV
ncbi:MAG TPA: class I SAM-dependent methyltransferase [Solirubrobacteraceae bacterium]|nr:class I SAM-dependent methyltransferase [Solirubrobacteraceae bacterium]